MTIEVRILSFLKRVFVYLAFVCSRRLKKIHIKKTKFTKDRILFLISKDKLSVKEKKELNILLNESKEDVIWLG